MTRLWIHLIVVPVGTALGTFSIFRALLVGPFIAVPMLLVALAAAIEDYITRVLRSIGGAAHARRAARLVVQRRRPRAQIYRSTRQA
jgi:hypothetical protein